MAVNEIYATPYYILFLSNRRQNFLQHGFLQEIFNMCHTI